MAPITGKGERDAGKGPEDVTQGECRLAQLWSTSCKSDRSRLCGHEFEKCTSGWIRQSHLSSAIIRVEEEEGAGGRLSAVGSFNREADISPVIYEAGIDP